MVYGSHVWGSWSARPPEPVGFEQGDYTSVKTVAIILLSLVSILPYAANAKPIAICGPFTISSSDDGFAHINNVRPQSQKFTFLRKATTPT